MPYVRKHDLRQLQDAGEGLIRLSLVMNDQLSQQPMTPNNPVRIAVKSWRASTANLLSKPAGKGGL